MPRLLPQFTKKRFAIALIVMALLLMAGELFSLYYLGLGDPPLYAHDEEIEYFILEGDYDRFGHQLKYNRWHMRSDAITQIKTNQDEIRVLMIGDSILNGGSQTGHHQLATTLLENKLNEKFNRPIRVCNISTGSWGPENHLAYLKRFGAFDADIVVWLISSHEQNDSIDYGNPTAGFPSHPTTKPSCALEELVFYYAARELKLQARKNETPITPELTIRVKKRCHTLINLLLDKKIKLVIAHHQERREIEQGMDEGFKYFKGLAEQYQLLFVEMGPAFEKQYHEGDSPYKDYIHPNALGQKIMSQTIYPILEDLILKEVENDG